MFVSVVFPIADFRGLHKESMGRLDRPAWGAVDPMARFARGFGEIHTRTKPGNLFAGENYYADCNSLVKYPKILFVQPLFDFDRPTLMYPLHRRFYADGQFSGRIELGFRLNEASIWEIDLRHPHAKFDPISTATQVMKREVEIELLDGRRIVSDLYNSNRHIRDGYILSSTKNQSLSRYDISEIQNYVSVGSPFAFVRSAHDLKIVMPDQHRYLTNSADMSLFLARSGLHGQAFDIAAIPSRFNLEQESARERIARIVYCQLRTLSFAHSFYLRQIADRKLAGLSELKPSLNSLLERLKLLESSDSTTGSKIDEEIREIIKNTDIDTSTMANEIRRCVRPSIWRRYFGGFFGYFDKKADVAIEAAASAATKQILGGGL